MDSRPPRTAPEREGRRFMLKPLLLAAAAFAAAVALPASAQSIEEQARFAEAQTRFQSELARFQAAFDRYTAPHQRHRGTGTYDRRGTARGPYPPHHAHYTTPNQHPYHKQTLQR